MRFGTQVRLLFGALGVVSLLSCGKGERAATGTARTQGTARPVQVGLAVLRPMEHTITAVGTLAPQETSTLSTKVTGRIQRLDVDIGSTVKRGDLIAQIEPRDYELKVQQAAAALAEARAALGLPLNSDTERPETEAISSVKQAKAVLEEATKSVERVRRLTLAQIASASELDTAEAAYKVALTRYDAALEEARARVAALAERRVEHEIARKQLSDASVLAPFDGSVQARPASAGEYVAAGTPIATLVKVDPLRLRLEVPERQSMVVRSGQTVRLMVEGDTNVFTGRIARLSPALNETNRVLLVEADVPSQGILRAGLFASADIVINEREERLSVPDSALVTFAGIEKVVTIRESKALERPVTTGRRGPGWVEILSGLEPGATVVLDPRGLRSGQAVKVTPGPEPVRTTSTGARLTHGS